MNTWDNRRDAGRPAAPRPHRHRKRGRTRLAVIVSAAAVALLAIGGGAVAVTVTRGHGSDAAGLSNSLSSLAAARSVTAEANVTPPVSAASCAKPVNFSYSGTLSVAVPGTVTYRWVYSTGKLGPVETARFAHPGHQVVAGMTVATRKAGGGWAELKVTSPVGRTSNKAAYQLLCGGESAGGISAAAAVTPADQTAGCTTAPPDFTAHGTIRTGKAETVTYYWAQSNGRDSAPATLTFPGPGTKAVVPLSIAPGDASGTGEAVLVVSGPVAVASRPAAYTLTCKALPATPGGSTPTGPGASDPGDPTAPATTPSGPSAGPSGSPTSGPSGSPSSPSSPSSSPSSPSAGPSSPSGSAPASPSGQLVVGASSALPDGVVGGAYSGSVSVSGGSGRYTSSDTGLPPGLTIVPGRTELDISGVPTASGTYSVTVSVTDTRDTALSGTAAFTLSVTFPQLTTTVNAPAAVYVGQAYSGTVTAALGDGTYNWGPVNNLPAGMSVTVNGDTLTIGGTPAGPGQLEISGTVSDGESPAETASWSLALTVSWAPGPTSPAPSTTSTATAALVRAATAA